MKGNTHVIRIQIIVQLVCKITALITAKPKLSGVQPPFHATGDSENSLGRPVFYNTGASLTKAQ